MSLRLVGPHLRLRKRRFWVVVHTRNPCTRILRVTRIQGDTGGVARSNLAGRYWKWDVFGPASPGEREWGISGKGCMYRAKD